MRTMRTVTDLPSHSEPAMRDPFIDGLTGRDRGGTSAPSTSCTTVHSTTTRGTGGHPRLTRPALSRNVTPPARAPQSHKSARRPPSHIVRHPRQLGRFKCTGGDLPWRAL